MPDWEYKLWNEDNFDVYCNDYCREAYEARKFAFVSDYVRLWALEREGGLYMDVDFEVFKSFEPLLVHSAFAGFEGSKRNPVMMGVCASQPHGEWITEMLDSYNDRHFILTDGSYDMTPNTSFLSNIMCSKGFVMNGREQDYKDLHVFPVDYFCPRLTTGEYIRTENTYCEHLGLASWAEGNGGWKEKVLSIFGPEMRIRLIKLKRKILD